MHENFRLIFNVISISRCFSLYEPVFKNVVHVDEVKFFLHYINVGSHTALFFCTPDCKFNKEKERRRSSEYKMTNLRSEKSLAVYALLPKNKLHINGLVFSSPKSVFFQHFSFSFLSHLAFCFLNCCLKILARKSLMIVFVTAGSIFRYI